MQGLNRTAAENIRPAEPELKRIHIDCMLADVSSSDVSCKAKNKSECAGAIARMPDANHPAIDYIVSDDYEVPVDPETDVLYRP
jgi:hypothetical protein